MKKHRPIGLFDSGVGGLTVLEQVHQLMPQEDLVYIADSGNAPYGDKSVDFIRQRAVELCNVLIEQDVKAIVIACNTATAAAAEHCREIFDLPIIAMEPGVKPALENSKNGLVGVLATKETAHSAQLDALISTFAGDRQVLVQACPGLVEQIEADQINDEKTKRLLREYLAPMQSLGVDTIVLGCSHYPIVRQQIHDIVGADVTLIETGTPVAKELLRRLRNDDLCSDAKGQGELRIFSSAVHAKTEKIIKGLTSLPYKLIVLAS